MRGDGFQQSVYAADPRRPESRWAALVMAGLIGTSFVLGALGTHLMLTGRLQTREVSVRPIDIASVAASREVASKGTGKLDGADREPEPGASPSVLPSGSPLPALVSLSPRRDGAVLAVESLRLPASSLPHSSRAPLPAPENAEVLFDVPIGGNVILPVKTKNVAPVYPYVARTARIGGGGRSRSGPHGRGPHCGPPRRRLGSVARRGDIVANRRGDHIVAHRVVRVERHNEGPAFLMRGDAAMSCDPPVTQEQILGKVVSVERRGRQRKVSSRSAKLAYTARVAASRLKRSIAAAAVIIGVGAIAASSGVEHA